MKKRDLVLLGLSSFLLLPSCSCSKEEVGSIVESEAKYSFKEIEWSNDFSKAYAVLVNDDNSSDIKKEELTISKNTKEASCLDEGLITYTVSYNGQTYNKTQKIDAKGHRYNETIVTPTFEADGYTHHECSDCGDKFDDTVTAKLIHSYSDNYTINEDGHYRSCTDAGYETLRVDEGNHSYVPRNVEVEGQVEAYLRYECVCGKHYDYPYTNNYTYTLNEDEESYTLSGTIETTLDYGIIPALHNGKPVTAIGVNALASCFNLKKLVIPGCVRLFDTAAFGSLTIESVFYNGNMGDWCQTEIKSRPVKETNNFYILDNDGDVEFSVYKYKLLRDVVIPEGITEIPEYQFRGFKDFDSVSLPHSLTKVGKRAFARDNNGSPYVYANKLYYNGTIADWLNIEIEDIYTVPRGRKFYLPDENGEDEVNGVKYSHASKIVIPEGTKEIKANQFFDFMGIDAFIVSEGVETVGDHGLHMYSLKNIYLPSTLKTVGTYAICLNNSESYSLYYGSDYSNYRNIVQGDWGMPINASRFYTLDENGDVTFEGKQYSLLTQLTVEENATEVPDYFANGLKQLETINIPETVKRIGSYAFYSCSKLKEVALPSNLEEIGEYAFARCNGITSITLPTTLKVIGERFLESTSIENIYIPGEYKILTEYSFNGLGKGRAMVIGEGIETICMGAIDDFGTSCKSSPYNQWSPYIVFPKSLKKFERYSLRTDKVEHYYYKGTQADWSNIEIVSEGNSTVSSFLYFYSETEPSTSGKYWHYVNDVPTVWGTN